MTTRIIAGIIGASSLAFATHASAAETIKVPLEIEVGAEYHFQLFNTDDGLKNEGQDVKETDFATRAAKLSIRGKLTDQISWNVLYQLNTNIMERYWVTNKVTDTLDVSVGKVKIRTAGWNRKLAVAWNSPIRSNIQNVNPLTDAVAVEVVYKMFGTWAIQGAKDYFDTSANCQAANTPTSTATQVCTSWNGYEVQKQPAITLEWVGSFGEWQPLVQYASYDRNHSWIGTLGLRYKSDLLDIYGDYILDTRNNKGIDALGVSEDRENKTTGIVLHGEIFTGTWTPYFLFSDTNLDEFTAPGASESKVNTSGGSVSDNERIYSVGTYYEGYGNIYRPYIGVALQSGKYYDDVLAKTGEETRTKTDVHVGLTGKF